MGTIPGNNIPGNPFHDFITGQLKYFPAEFSANPTKKYPVIIYLHGHSAQSNGGANDLCLILSDMEYTIPWNIENNRFPEPFNYNGTDYNFIVLCPQFRGYGDPYHFNNQLDAYITWILGQSQYQIDPDRIYLTGASAGANLVVDYISSSVEHAERIAAATLPSLCYRVDQQVLGVNGPAVIAEAQLPTWFMQCSTDGNPCQISVPTDWVNGINAQPEKVTPRFTVLNPNPGNIPFGDSLLYCRGWAHLTWGAMYYPPQPSGTFSPDFFTWNLQHSRASTLPVKLKDFSLKAVNGKVQLKWTTSSEEDNLQFTVERAGADQRFQKLSVIPGKGTTNLEQVYEYTDNQPLENLNYYRLVQKDIDGREKIFDAKRIMMRRDGKSLVTVSSNPFTTELSAFVTVQHAQQVRLSITDMSGKVWANINGRYTSGSSEVSLPVGNLPKGVYLLKATGDGISSVVKIIKR
ncbi:T9SS type A sorting domain-containing protein [Pseudoflavitalea rhizosphaerae]|uniref:T9SS type A sorting domain-containing protein n=1 Tax=Pseudoflavitalea rhizosphaerae TaxID=1884793 RepID=UPI0013E0D15D|nr:T9SS type A sorting domain-containing protein [Pseudoflavitalea rhizosphaerae]